ncbi:SGNH/GDSL hydrolase family protein [bacterium]|nr:SGNH/GDSL hydrolase family protein [bacterium]
MKSYLKYSLLILVSCVFVACSKSKDAPAPAPKIINSKPGAGSVYVIGDSLAYGTGATDNSVTPSGCLQENFSSALVSNYGIPGLKTDELVDNVTFYLKQPPKLVFISTGGNDAFLEYSNPGAYPADKSVRELKRIILQFQKVGSVVAYLAINPPYDAKASSRLVEMANVARENGVIVINGMDGLWTDSTKMSDQFHPNDKGYEVMCDRMVQAISPHFP